MDNKILGTSINQFIKDIQETEIFQTIKKERPEYFEKAFPQLTKDITSLVTYFILLHKDTEFFKMSPEAGEMFLYALDTITDIFTYEDAINKVCPTLECEYIDDCDGNYAAQNCDKCPLACRYQSASAIMKNAILKIVPIMKGEQNEI